MPSCLFTSSIVSSSAARGILLLGFAHGGGDLLRGGCDGVARRWLPLAPAPEGALTVDRSASRGLHVEAQLGAEVADDVILCGLGFAPRGKNISCRGVFAAACSRRQ